MVHTLSEFNWKQDGHNLNKRGKFEHHLDHLVPIIYGFRNNIPPEAIADIINLELIPFKDNLSKSGKMYKGFYRSQ